MQEQLLFGRRLTDGRYRPTGRPPRVFFRDAGSGEVFALDDTALSQNILFLGGSGSGKTNAIHQILPQLRAPSLPDGKDRVTFLFDTKADYFRHPGFFQPGDYVLGSSPAFREQSAVWNLFADVRADGDDPRDWAANANEIAAGCFHGRGSQTQPFFANAARDLFAHTILYFLRRGQDRPQAWQGNLNNQKLVEFLRITPPAKLAEYFSLYPDFQWLQAYFGDGTSNQALGVFSELYSMLQDCFQGVFAQAPARPEESFSIRQAIRAKGGRAIFLEYDLALGATLTPIYRLLADLALKEALSGGARGHAHFFLDEFKLLPKLSHLEDALNFGRSKGVTVVAGLQSVEQIYAAYGREAGQVILGGFGSVVAFRTGDYASREYVSKLFGPNITSYRYLNASNSPVDREREGSTVEHWQQRSLRPGQAVVGLSTQEEPFLFQFELDRF